MNDDTNDAHSRRRETRLLILIVVVSIAVLLVLARLRFPAAALTVSAPPAGPLASLAGRATFDDLGDTLAMVLGRVTPRVLRVELGAVPPAVGNGPRDRVARGVPRGGTVEADPTPVVATRVVLALRVRADRALVHVPSGWQPRRLIDTGLPADIVAVDAQRELVLLRIPPVTDVRVDPAFDAFAGLAYVSVVDAASTGPTIQPMFIGRVSALSDLRWPGPLYEMASTPGLMPGMLLFSMQGRLIGLTTRSGDTDRLVPASVLEAVVVALIAERPGGL